MVTGLAVYSHVHLYVTRRVTDSTAKDLAIQSSQDCSPAKCDDIVRSLVLCSLSTKDCAGSKAKDIDASKLVEQGWIVSKKT